MQHASFYTIVNIYSTKKKSKSEQGMDYSLNQERFNQRRANDQTGVKFQTKL